ncbi:MAG: SMC-Scp complex subunit ScpB [Planctomycetes bacterium]|nr:SMC-Scp complex subunit ScpB [Planctomycetota bacterium]
MFRGYTPRTLTAPRPPRNHAPRSVHRLGIDIDDADATNDPQARDTDLALLEAVLLIADEPLPARKLSQITGFSDVRRLLKRLQELYDASGSAFELEELAGGYQLLTRPEYHRWLTTLKRSQVDLRLTGASRETLAIVAYRQPIMRADIEAIRGVHCGETLRLLMEKGLVKIVGRHDSLGRPVLYGTTKRFLQVFGLKSLKDLPNVGAT